MNIKNFVPLFNGKNIPDTVKQITVSIGQLWRELILTSNTVKTINQYLKDSIDLGFVKKKLGELDEVKLENPVEYIVFATEPTEIPQDRGSVYYDNKDDTLNVVCDNDVTLQVNQETVIPALNKTGTLISNGKLVYVNGAQGTRATVALASNTTYSNACKTIAMTTQDIDTNVEGKCTVVGLVRGLDTQGITEGTELWLGTNGNWTSTMPTAGTARVRIGIVVKEHVTDGWILVKIQEKHYMFGAVDDGDYSYFDDDGTLEMVGDATVWEDLNFDVVRSGGPVAFRPDDVTINNIYYKEFTSSNNQTCGAEEEVPHNALLGGDFYPHAHGFLKSGESAGTTGITIRIYWELRQSTGTTNGSVDISKTSAEISANANKIDFYDSSFTGPTELGAQLAMRLDRISGDCGDFIFTTYGIHYEKDTIGSREITSK